MSQGLKDFLWVVLIGTIVVLFLGKLSYDADHAKVGVFKTTPAQAAQYKRIKVPTPLPEGVIQLDVNKFLVQAGAERQMKYICTHDSYDQTKGMSSKPIPLWGWWYVQCWAPQKQY